ncbi:MAG TPA: DUF6057 family protein [Prolixibacteraceae bacterium]|nr:DUF6057 family protein [Prolixibacteraceae bacterium]
MQSNLKRITIKKELVFSVLPYLIFFAGSFIYFGFFVDYIFFYQEKSTLFITSSDFLVENLHQPGGLLVYLGKFLSTFFYYPLFGAAIVSMILTLIVVVVSKIISSVAGKHVLIVPFIFGILLFYLQADYRFQLFNNLGVLLQLSLFYLSIRFMKSWRGWIPVLFTPFLYFVTGSFALLFCLMLTFYLVFEKKSGWIRVIMLWVLMLITIYISKEFLFFQTEETLLKFPFLDINTGEQQLLFLPVAGILSFLPLIARIKFSMPDKFRISVLAKRLVTTFVLVIALSCIGFQRFDIKLKEYFHVEKLFYQNKFEEVIAYNIANPSSNSLTIFLNNIALCETDQLNDLLFHFRQSSDGNTLFLKWEMIGEVLKRGGYFYYTIGIVNEAHRWAFENMVMTGHSPEGLKMLIRTELISGNYKMASKYIDLLKNTFFYSKEARAFEKLLFNDKAIDADKELGVKRRNIIETDFFSITDDANVNIERILSKDSLNRKAFEYKMAFLLLKKDYQHITEFLPQFEGLGFNKIPMHIGEAAIAFSTLNNKPLPVLGRLSIDPQTEPRWTQFLQTFQANGNNLKAAEPALRKDFRNTYWYYSFYR